MMNIDVRSSGYIGFALCFSVLLITGCSKTEVANNVDSGAAYNSADEAMQAKDYAAAIEHFTTAMEAGGLNPDQYADSRIRRAECYGRTGDYPAAHADLDNAEMGAPDMDRVYATRSFVFEAEGKKSEASSAMAKAKKENRSVKAIK